MEKQQSSVPGFLTKLWTLVEDETTDDIIRWADTGKSFQILDGGRLAKELLPLFFKHSNLASFIRQLNMYGFHKVLSGSAIERSAYSDDMEFAHPCFLRGRAELLERIKRKVTYGRSGILEPVSYPVAASPMRGGQAGRGGAVGGANQSGVGGGGVVMSADAMQRQPIRDFPRLVQQVATLQAKQNAMNARLSSVKQENEALWRELHALRTRNSKQQVIVSKIVQFLVSLVGQSGPSTARFLGGGFKRKMNGQPYGGPAAIMLDSMSSASSSFPGNQMGGNLGGALALRSNAQAQSSLATAAADLLQAASQLVNSGASGGPELQQTVFVEEIDDDADVGDMPISSTANAGRNWSAFSGAGMKQSNASNKRMRVQLTPNGDGSADSAYGYSAGEGNGNGNGNGDGDGDGEGEADEAYGDGYNYMDGSYYDADAGVQISELESIWPASVAAQPAPSPASSVGVNSVNLAGNANANGNGGNAAGAGQRPPSATSMSNLGSSANSIDINALFASIADAQTPGSLDWPASNSLGRAGTAANATRNRASSNSSAEYNQTKPHTLDDPIIELPDLNDETAARSVLADNLESIQSQLDGLRAFLAGEQYTPDDTALMELFNTESGAMGSSSASGASVGSGTGTRGLSTPRYSGGIVGPGHELVAYTDPINFFDMFADSSGSNANANANGGAAASTSTSTKGGASRSGVETQGQAGVVKAGPAGESEKKAFIVKTFAPTSAVPGTGTSTVTQAQARTTSSPAPAPAAAATMPKRS